MNSFLSLKELDQSFTPVSQSCILTDEFVKKKKKKKNFHIRKVSSCIRQWMTLAG